jgi:hypothetical protein
MTDKRTRDLLPATFVLLFGSTLPARAQLTNQGSFDPSNAANLCSIGFDSGTGSIWVYECHAATVQEYSDTGVFLSEIPSPGEVANDVDIEFAPEAMMLGGVALPEGTMLFLNGESGVVEVYALDKTDGTVLATLVTAYGGSHVVGGGYHPVRDTLFFIQDTVPSGTPGDRVGEVDPVTGAELNSFSLSPSGYSVFFGDLDIAHSGNLLLVSSSQTTIAEFTPAGAFVKKMQLPQGISGLSGIAVTEESGVAWVCSTAGLVTKLSGLSECGSATNYCTSGISASGCQAAISTIGVPSATAASGFDLTAASVEGAKDGLFFFGTSGRQANPWGNGTSYQCVVPPVKRGGLLSGSGNPGACDGSFTQDLNARWTARPGQNPGAGTVVQAQLWYRDPFNTSNQTTSLSNAIEFSVCP